MLVTESEQSCRDAVIAAILDCIAADRTIKLPDYDPLVSKPSLHFALTSVGVEANPFGGTVDRFRYQFEGEEDLLHLIVTAIDGSPLSPQESQQVAGFVLGDVPAALIWLKPGTYSQHFYVGHEELRAAHATA